MYRRIVAMLLVSALFISMFCFNISANDEVGQPVMQDETLNINGAIPYSEYYEKNSDVQKSGASVSVEINSSLLWNKDSASYTYDLEVTESALYSLELTYFSFENGTGDIFVSCLIDNVLLFNEAGDLNFHRKYKDLTEIRSDSKGNEIAPEQEISTDEITERAIKEKDGSEFLFYLTKGTHTITINSDSNYFGITDISFVKPNDMPSYKEYLKNNKSFTEYKDSNVTVQGETAIWKTQNNLIPLSDNSSAGVSPQDAFVSKVNYIGGDNWDTPGEGITWSVEIEKSGLYQIGINYRQKYTLNTVFYRSLSIDGKVPFSEASELPFEYSRNWKFKILSSEDGEPFQFYFGSGTHEISLIVTQGPITEVANNLETTCSGIATLYRNIVMITGDTPDINRDYNLFKQIPDFIGKLTAAKQELQAIKKQLDAVNQNEGSDSSATINNMIDVLDKMINNKYSAHRYISRYYTCYASLNSMQMDLSSMPMDIDLITFGNNFTDTKAGFFEKVLFSFKRFIWAFTDEYSTSSNDNEAITLWVNWGRDQVKALRYLAESDFSVETGINVDIKLTNATILQGILSGNGPDCVLHASRSEPINLAIREAAYDLTNFSDCDQVLENFQTGADIPYRYLKDGHNGLYALPDTQTFFAMFIRTDIFNDLGLEVPKTWNEFKFVVDELSRQNMQVGLPYTQITEMTQVNSGIGSLSIFPTLLLQNGGSLYKDDLKSTNLLDKVSIETFEQWVDFYQKRSLPLTYDFYNRFRLGLMPMAIQTYSIYATLSAAAGDIKGCWKMFEVPGNTDGNGSVTHQVTGGGTGCLILEASKHKESAWKFLKWWVSEDIQYRYCRDVETVLGPSARVATSNIATLQRFEWDEENFAAIMEQWKNVQELPEVPGGYYVSRVLDQAFWNTVNAGKNAKDNLLEWSQIADNEIKRKYSQYE